MTPAPVRTISVTIDMRKSFDTINIHTLIRKLLQTKIPGQSAQSDPTIFNNGRYTTNIPTEPHTIPTTDLQPNMRHMHTSIVSRHLATRVNNKILRTPPPHIISSEEVLPHLTRRTLVKIRTNKHPFSNHIYTKSTSITPITTIPPL